MPYMMGLGATDDAQIAYDYGKVTAIEARSIGANWTFSPVSDLNKNRRNPLVNNRGLTDDEKLASKMLPQIALGHSQSFILNSAHFENEVLHLSEIMIPPLLSSTMSSEDVLGKKGQSNTAASQSNKETSGQAGRPEKPDDQKSDKTIANRESMN